MTSLSVVFITEERCCVAAAFTQLRAGILLTVVWTHRAELAELAELVIELESGHRLRAVRLWAQDHRQARAFGDARQKVTLKNKKRLLKVYTIKYNVLPYQ